MEQEINLQHVVNSLSQQGAEMQQQHMQEKAYNEAIITALKEENDRLNAELAGENKEEQENAE